MKSLNKTTRFLRYEWRLLISAIVGAFTVLLVLAGATSPAPANGDGGGNVASPSDIIVIGDNVEMRVQNPLKLSYEGFALNFFYKGEPVDLWPGQEVASGYVTVENVSPIPYFLEFSAVPLSSEAYVQTPFSVTLDKPWEPWKGDALQPGQEIRVYVHISLPYWAEASMPFRGLKLLVKPQPPAPVLSGESG